MQSRTFLLAFLVLACFVVYLLGNWGHQQPVSSYPANQEGSGPTKITKVNRNGQLLWTYHVSRASRFTVDGNGNSYICLLGKGSLVCLDQNRNRRWEASLDPKCFQTPMIYQGKLFIVSQRWAEFPANHYLAKFTQDGKRAWLRKMELPVNAYGPVIRKNTLLFTGRIDDSGQWLHIIDFNGDLLERRRPSMAQARHLLLMDSIGTEDKRDNAGNGYVYQWGPEERNGLIIVSLGGARSKK